MLSNIPAHGIDEDLVRAEIATLRSEIAELRVEVAGYDSKMAGFDTKIESVRTEIQASANRLIIWALGADVALAGVIIAFVRST